ncbi:Hypothetical predicted protein [Mytilus galloprovincialis]|uniref:Uncharacterized protein n=1 Tax=Mytilus galloprovincialis TaxID=29158 RepID=A0A8B6FRY1_MYTGA|nr:Hypothetical predicted protein [Mytilus galloprovincialis]
MGNQMLLHSAKLQHQYFMIFINASDPESEKMNIIKAAASLIKSDIKSKIGTKTEYPSVSDVESLECNEHYLPDSLRLFLNSLISTCNHSLKLSAIGQTIIQATRPRSLIAPLQIGLAVQMHHHFGSRFLIDSLYNMGFSSSYSEVQRYEMNAAMSQGTDIPEVTEEGNLQYIADNVDHNLRTIDGHGTFHGMGIIASVTPRIYEDKLYTKNRCKHRRTQRNWKN